MRFFQSALLAVSALASVALAQSSTLSFTNVPTSVIVGQSYKIEWKTTDTTSVRLLSDLSSESELINRIARHHYSAQGPLWKPSDHFHFDLYEPSPKSVLNNLLTKALVATATGTAYTWIPDKSLADGSDYALQITQGNQINYSGQISLSGGSLSAISSSASASASSSVSASSSASAASVSSSVLSTAITGNSTASVTPSVSAASTGKGNSTISTATLSATVKITSAASTGASGTPTTAAQGAPTGAAGQLGSSPMALIFGAVAAMAYLN